LIKINRALLTKRIGSLVFRDDIERMTQHAASPVDYLRVFWNFAAVPFVCC